ncbi:5-oxoprolinase, partial [Operophtera brumata]
MALAHIVQEAQAACAWLYSREHFEQIDTQLDVLSAVCRNKLRAQGIPDAQIQLEPYLHLRYAGTDCALMVSPTPGDSATACKHGDFYSAFFGFTLSDRDVIVDDVRVRGVGLSSVPEDAAPSSDTSIYLLEKLLPQQVIPGPAIIMDNLSTILVEPNPKPIFFVASRGHHADIGGLTPGSMPPHSTSLAQEGAAFKSMLLVDGGNFNEKLLTEELMRPASVPGCSGTRNLADNFGTGVEVWGNLNAPRAIALSALIYCLRCMVGHDVPLNQVCAASQGCMNNLTLGEEDWGYYETVAGGSGAGPGWVGSGGVHTHMTNTRITDVEIVERRYPMLVSKFSLRPGSGGKGGEPGERGLNLLKRVDGRLINLGAKASIEAYPGWGRLRLTRHRRYGQTNKQTAHVCVARQCIRVQECTRICLMFGSGKEWLLKGS